MHFKLRKLKHATRLPIPCVVVVVAGQYLFSADNGRPEIHLAGRHFLLSPLQRVLRAPTSIAVPYIRAGDSGMRGGSR